MATVPLFSAFAVDRINIQEPKATKSGMGAKIVDGVKGKRAVRFQIMPSFPPPGETQIGFVAPFGPKDYDPKQPKAAKDLFWAIHDPVVVQYLETVCEHVIIWAIANQKMLFGDRFSKDYTPDEIPRTIRRTFVSPLKKPDQPELSPLLSAKIYLEDDAKPKSMVKVAEEDDGEKREFGPHVFTINGCSIEPARVLSIGQGTIGIPILKLDSVWIRKGDWGITYITYRALIYPKTKKTDVNFILPPGLQEILNKPSTQDTKSQSATIETSAGASTNSKEVRDGERAENPSKRQKTQTTEQEEQEEEEEQGSSITFKSWDDVERVDVNLKTKESQSEPSLLA